MSTTAPPPSMQNDQPKKASLGSVYKGAGSARDGGWGKIRQMVKDGRRVSREERLRWQENREYYRGNQSVYIAPGESQLRGSLGGAMNQRNRDNSYNRLRQFTDGRTALLTKERPPYEVSPESRDQEAIDAARFAEKFVAARWGNAGWNIKPRISELCQNGDIDGLAWLSVSWDPEAGSSSDNLIAVDGNGEPIRDRAVYEALVAEDPTGSSLWRMVRSKEPMGDVTWRVVLPGAISVDPFAIKDHRDAKWICESRVRPRDEVEKRMGMSFKDAVRESQSSMGERVTDVQYEDLTVDDGGALGRTVNESTSIVVHYFYAKPCHDFPSGAHIEFCDKAPGKPMLVEEWQEGLPYFCFVPRPDPGHFIRSRGIVDDLKPIQRDYNSTLRDLREWLKRVARTPVALPFGSMASDEYFNDDGVFFYHPAMGEPHHSNVPAEPTAVLTNDLGRMVAEMRDISGVSASAQGLRAPGGPDAAVGINLEIQQTESNLSVMESNLVEAIEWGVSRSLVLVEKHYSGVRTVTGVGVDDAEEFQAFQGQMLRGAHRFRVTGPMMPKSKAARMASLQNLLPLMAQSGNFMPFIGSLIDGDPTELQADVEADRKHQQGETRELLGLATDEKALLVNKNFESDKQAFTEALNAAIGLGAPDPMAILAQQGIRPPNLTQSLRQAGFDMPLVEDFNNHALELKALDEFRKGNAYRRISQMGKQLLREHADQHKQQMAAQLQAMSSQQPMAGQQQGSAPKEPGTPSQPKNTPPQPGGM